MKKLSYLLFSLFLILASCAKDGDPGPIGKDGTDGADGANGNANVQTFLFNDPVWTNTNQMNLNVPAITENVLNSSVILGYVQLGINWYLTDAYYISGYFRSFAFEGEFSIRAHNNDNTNDATPPTVAVAKIIIIESTNTTETTGNGRVAAVSPQQAILNQLAIAGVDINDYEQIAAYYNLQD